MRKNKKQYVTEYTLQQSVNSCSDENSDKISVAVERIFEEGRHTHIAGIGGANCVGAGALTHISGAVASPHASPLHLAGPGAAPSRRRVRQEAVVAEGRGGRGPDTGGPAAWLRVVTGNGGHSRECGCAYDAQRRRCKVDAGL